MFLEPEWFPLGEWSWAINGDSTGPSRALDQATQSRPLSHDSLGSALQALGCEAYHSSTRLEILRLVTETLQTKVYLWNRKKWLYLPFTIFKRSRVSQHAHYSSTKRGWVVNWNWIEEKKSCIPGWYLNSRKKNAAKREKMTNAKRFKINIRVLRDGTSNSRHDKKKKRTSYSAWTVETLKKFSINISKSCIFIFMFRCVRYTLRHAIERYKS